jgi:hypothetical protein
MANVGGRELTDYPYYLEKDWPIYSTKNKHQKAGSIKLNTMRNPEMCGYMTGAEYIAMVKDMALELKEAYQVAMEVLGTEPSERMGTEEVIPLSHGTPTLPQNSGSFVSEKTGFTKPIDGKTLFMSFNGKVYCPACTSEGRATELTPEDKAGSLKWNNPVGMCGKHGRFFGKARKDGDTAYWDDQIQNFLLDYTPDKQYIWEAKSLKDMKGDSK